MAGGIKVLNGYAYERSLFILTLFKLFLIARNRISKVLQQ